MQAILLYLFIHRLGRSIYIDLWYFFGLSYKHY